MEDPKKMEAGEQAEDQAFQQIMQICQQAGQSGDPSGYQQIMQIIQSLEQHNQEEEQEMGGEEEAPQDMASKVMGRIKANQAAQQSQGA